MNCQLCQKNLEAYQEGRLPSDMMTQVESHINTCDSCKRIYNIQLLAEKVISTEKEMDPDPFLITRVMAQIENLESESYRSGSLTSRILRPALISVSLAAAVFLGILLGTLSRPAGYSAKIPVELALINDASLESVDILSNE
jgi:predicted anti-sigma-YlaC factor YlaD